MKFFDTPSTVKLTIKIMARFCIENDKLIFSDSKHGLNNESYSKGFDLVKH